MEAERGTVVSFELWAEPSAAVGVSLCFEVLVFTTFTIHMF